MQLPESATGTVVTQNETTETTTTYRHTISKSDPYLIDRIVGYHEYGKALHYLDRLVAECNEYEVEAVDEIVKLEPEFAIFTVSNGELPAQASLETSGHDGGRRRHGLKWVTALARVEVGAMEAGFAQSPQPFSHARSPGYDAAEYKTLLMESARIHFWTLSRDPMFASLSRRFQPSSWTLAYLRRLNIATAFALAAGQVANRTEPALVSEMSNYVKRLHAARSAIQLKIAAYLAQVEFTRQVQSRASSSQTLAELCNEGVCRTFSQ